MGNKQKHRIGVKKSRRAKTHKKYLIKATEARLKKTQTSTASAKDLQNCTADVETNQVSPLPEPPTSNVRANSNESTVTDDYHFHNHQKIIIGRRTKAHIVHRSLMAKHARARGASKQRCLARARALSNLAASNPVSSSSSTPSQVLNVTSRVPSKTTFRTKGDIRKARLLSCAKAREVRINRITQLKARDNLSPQSFVQSHSDSDQEESESPTQIKFENGDDNDCESEFELKEEPDERGSDEDLMEIGLDYFDMCEPVNIGTDPLRTGESNPLPASEQCDLNESRCLICFQEDPDPRPLKGILPKRKGLTNPEHVEDDMRILYLLKLAFQWGRAELSHLMKIANGRSPRNWIHICQPCRLFIFEIQTLEDRMRDCRAKIRDKMMKSADSSDMSKVEGTYRRATMTRRIRGFIIQEVKSAKENAALFSNGDREAERLNNFRVQKRKLERSELVQFRSRGKASFQSGPEENSVSSDDHFCEDASMESSLPNDEEYNRVDNMSGAKSRHRNNSKTSFNVGPYPDTSNMGQLDGHINIKDYRAPYMKESFLCLVCSSSKRKLRYNGVKMSISDLFYHLIFHHDSPMRCSACHIFLPRRSTTLVSHWRRCHSDVTATSQDKRYFDTQVCIDRAKKLFKNDLASKPSTNDKHSISCEDCSEDEGANIKFDSIDTFKIHQALEHPEVARMSCPLCLQEFEHEPDDSKWKLIIKNHIDSVHGHGRDSLSSWKSTPCKHCGELLPNIPSAADTEEPEGPIIVHRLHMMSSHAKLINGVYTCTKCQQHFFLLKDFVGHQRKSVDHPDLNCRSDVILSHLCNISASGDYARCAVCPLQAGFEVFVKFRNVAAFLSHLNTSHSMQFTWDPEKLTDGTAKETSRRIKRPSKYYSCPACPQLKKMNLDTFIVHLLFHWRRPNKCRLCKVYLPFASAAIDNHWKLHHSDENSDSVVRFDPVNFTPGKYFGCEKCSEKFITLKDRNEHESTHESCSPKWKTCTVCNEGFRDEIELRLHKALDHPEVACVSCYYCDELFPMESNEGGQFLDLVAVQQHIFGKEDHLNKLGWCFQDICHLFACDFCGEVIQSSNTGRRVQTHVSEVHGKIAAKTPFTCHICNAEKRNLWVHVSTTHAKDCICETCGEEMRPWSLPDHNLIKHGILMEGHRDLSCTEDGCDYKTTHIKSLRRHIFVNHNKERKRTHKCTTCGKAFFSGAGLREHMERHNNKHTRPYQCEICGSSYAGKNDLYIHRRLSHLNQKFPSTNRKRPRKQKDIASLPKKAKSSQEIPAGGGLL